MTAEQLTPAAQLTGRTSGKRFPIEDFKPATASGLRQWKVNGHWFNLAQLEARFSLHNPERKAPPRKKKLAAA